MTIADGTTDPIYIAGMERLVQVIQELSMARSLERVMEIVRRAAREIVGADGATFVLRDGDQCYYADEEAIAPLWKGRRFPLEACISGWAMRHKASVRIENIYEDARIPLEAYEPTFVRSLVMVPIRQLDPIGAIGTYWADRHAAPDYHVRLLQSLADSTSIALENVSILQELDQRIQARTAELEAANLELGAFNSAVSHDLRNPLNVISGFANLLLMRDDEGLSPQVQQGLEAIARSSRKMQHLIEDLMRLSSVAYGELKHEPVDLSRMATGILSEFQGTDPERSVQVQVDSDLVATGDPGLLQIALMNLLSNAWKYTSRERESVIEVGRTVVDHEPVLFVRDNGIGFDMAQADRLFRSFARLSSSKEFHGTGIGLVTVRRIMERHGGRIWAESLPGKGATFFWTWPGAVPHQ
ncbi:MAG TPA: ATP-binding protein [Stenomitos sp.]